MFQSATNPKLLPKSASRHPMERLSKRKLSRRECLPFSISNCGVLIMKTDHWCSCWFNERPGEKSLFIKGAYYLYYRCIFPYVATLTMTRLQTNYYNKSLLKQDVSFIWLLDLFSELGAR